MHDNGGIVGSIIAESGVGWLIRVGGMIRISSERHAEESYDSYPRLSTRLLRNYPSPVRF